MKFFNIKDATDGQSELIHLQYLERDLHGSGSMDCKEKTPKCAAFRDRRCELLEKKH